ncbi:hypothetical protein TIFTF001_034007 [Ficus carica]|uniref:Uncharacterized protein n=1 Tax=Ficus carica TaxID=3494 RepID=A0AA88J4J8_FICCA|nr:hypothetical protein TIFTF001_034007 [Ficus carica]
MSVSVSVDVRIQSWGWVLGLRPGSGVGSGVRVRFWDKRRVGILDQSCGQDSGPGLRLGSWSVIRLGIRFRGQVWGPKSGLGFGTFVEVRIRDIGRGRSRFGIEVGWVSRMGSGFGVGVEFFYWNKYLVRYSRFRTGVRIEIPDRGRGRDLC